MTGGAFDAGVAAKDDEAGPGPLLSVTAVVTWLLVACCEAPRPLD